MRIWIVDDDVSFAYGLKSKLKAPGYFVEVFTDSSSFLNFLQKKKKEKGGLPHLIFLDVELPGKNGTEVYLDFLRNKDPLAECFYFCSNVSYGRFEPFFERRGISVPPFVEKGKLEKKLENIVQKFRPKEELSRRSQIKTLAIPLPLVDRYLHDLESTLKEMGDLYYSSKFKKKDINRFRVLTEELIKLATQLTLPKSAEKGSRTLSIFDRKPSPGVMRMKKELKELMAIVEKEMGAIF